MTHSRKTSISHVMNDTSTASSTSDHHHHQQSTSGGGGFSLKTILQPDEGPASHVHTQQHASPSQPSQYNHGVGNSGSSSSSNGVGYSGGGYSNEQPRDYHYSRSHQPPTQSQHSHNQEQNNQSYSMDDSLEAGSILLLLSNQSTSTQPQQSNSHYSQSRDHYPPKDNEQMSDVEAATTISSLSNNNNNNIKSNSQQVNQRQRAKSNTMSIASLCGDESASSESGHSMPGGSSVQETSQQQRYHHEQPYPEDMRNGDIHANNQMQSQQDYTIPYGPSGLRKHSKRPSGPTPLVVNTNARIPQKEPRMIQKRTSPQKRRPSDAVEFARTKVHHRNPEPNQFSHGPPTTSGGPRLNDVREQLGEERNTNRIASAVPAIPNHMEWDRSQHHPQQYRSSHNGPPQNEIPPNRYVNNNNHSPPIQKNGGSPSLHGDSQKLSYMNPNERLQNKTPSPTGPPVHAPNGYPHGHGVGVGGMIGTHTDMTPQPSQQPPPQMPPPQQIPSLRGQTAFNQQFPKKYHDMKYDPKMKRNAPHAYISYMIYTNQMENIKGRDIIASQQNNARQIISNGSPPMSNDHGMVNPPMVSHHQSQVNGGNMYGSRESQHPGYPPIQPGNSGYMHSSSESANSGVQPRRVSDPPMHSNVNAISRNTPHGYPPTHVNGPSAEEHQPPHRHSINSINSSPNLPPTHSSATNQHPPQRHVPLLPANQHPTQQRLPSVLTQSPPTSRSGQPPIQPLPPIQSAPSHLQSHHHHHSHPSNSHAHHHHYHPQENINHQSHAHRHSHNHYHQQPVSQSSQPPPPPTYMQGPAPHSYNGKSSAPQSQIPQSPAINSSRPPPQGPSYHHTPQPGPSPQSSSNRSHHHHHHHHHSSPSEPVNGNPNIINQPLTRFLDPQSSQQSGYGLHPPTNGVGPGGHPVHMGGPSTTQILGTPQVNGAGLGPRGHGFHY